MTQTEALKLALDALEPLIVERTCEAMDAGEKAITAIKEALAQKCVCGEPNSSGTHRTDGPCLAPQPEQEPATKEQIREAMVFNLPLYTMPPHPEQEPVAWGHPNSSITGRKQALMMVALEIPSNAQYPQLWVPLYTTPPQRTWVGLTPEERDEINEQVYGAVPHHVAFHHAIEAKLKEKNT